MKAPFVALLAFLLAAPPPGHGSESATADRPGAEAEAFAGAIKAGDHRRAVIALDALVRQAQAERKTEGLVTAVHDGLRQAALPACGLSQLAARCAMAAEFVRLRPAFVSLITQAATTALELAPQSGPCLTAMADAALLTGDLKLAARCTRQCLAGLTQPQARASTQRYLVELEQAGGERQPSP